MRTRVVVDGQLVKIPAPDIFRTVGTQEDRRTGERKNPAKSVAMPDRKIRWAKVKLESERIIVAKPNESKLSRKATIAICQPVP